MEYEIKNITPLTNGGLCVRVLWEDGTMMNYNFNARTAKNERWVDNLDEIADMKDVDMKDPVNVSKLKTKFKGKKRGNKVLSDSP